MESYDVFLIGNFLALPAFRTKYGVYYEGSGYVIETKWQSALQAVGPLGAMIGVFLAGPLTSRIGYRWATIAGLMLLNAFIFVFYFAKSLPLMFVSQLLEGIPWGIFVFFHIIHHIPHTTVLRRYMLTLHNFTFR